ncbi:MAG TPA: hypothetical protein VGG48_14115 [Rhizomicrobium sp.]|jgi:hypothetical protein
MLSGDLENLANAVDEEITAAVEEGKSINPSFLRKLITNLNSFADQARELEAQKAPGSRWSDNVIDFAAARSSTR